jgi:hypothetical protein
LRRLFRREYHLLMERLQRNSWDMMRLILCLAMCGAVFFVISCSREEQTKSPVDPIEFAGRPTYRNCALTTPVFGKWVGGFSDGYFTDEPDKETDFVEVTLELPLGSGNVDVPFQAAFSLKDLPADILDWDPKDIVSYDEATNTVTFDLGTARVTTQIPQKELSE